MIPNDNNEIVMEGNLFYRYGMDQIELDGVWSLSSEVAKCHFSYLLSCKQKVIKIHIDPKDLGIKDISQNNNDGGNDISKQIDDFNNVNANAMSDIRKIMVHLPPSKSRMKLLAKRLLPILEYLR